MKMTMKINDQTMATLQSPEVEFHCSVWLSQARGKTARTIRRLGVNQVARAAGLKPSHLSRWLAKRCGVNVGVFSNLMAIVYG